MMHNGFAMGFGQYGSWLHGPLGWIIILLFWGLGIYLAGKLFAAIFSGKKENTITNLEALKERYARGEIGEDEYHRMKSELA